MTKRFIRMKTSMADLHGYGTLIGESTQKRASFSSPFERRSKSAARYSAYAGFVLLALFDPVLLSLIAGVTQCAQVVGGIASIFRDWDNVIYL